MVMFYLPYCRKCKYMKPKFLQAAKKLEDQGCKVHLAECNARESMKMTKDMGIAVAPYVKVFNTKYEIPDAEQKAIRNSVKPIVELAEKCSAYSDKCGAEPKDQPDYQLTVAF